jgi:hypothetical protein
MAALLADGPGRPLQHRPEIIAQNAVGAANDVFSHFDPFRCFAQRAWAALPDLAGHAAPPDALPLDSRRTGVFNGNLHDGLLKAVQTNPNSHGPTVQAKYLCLRSLNHWRHADNRNNFALPLSTRQRAPVPFVKREAPTAPFLRN